MNTTLMRFSAKRALEEGSISQEKYSQILAQAERFERRKTTINERDIGKLRKNMLKQLIK